VLSVFAWAQITHRPLETTVDFVTSFQGRVVGAARDLLGGWTQSGNVRVRKVADGDTVEVQRFGRIRLHEIDAPELSQPYGPAARRALVRKIRSKNVRIVVYDTDQYGWKVAKIWLGDRDITREMVRERYAWAYRDYLWDWSLIADERVARNEGRGLWARDNPIPPWKWRRGNR
jgi:endonuclease YncB( thermonuclease family)